MRQGPCERGDSALTPEPLLLSGLETLETEASAQDGREAASPPGSHELSQLLKVVPLPLTLSRGDPDVCLTVRIMKLQNPNVIHFPQRCLPERGLCLVRYWIQCCL